MKGAHIIVILLNLYSVCKAQGSHGETVVFYPPQQMAPFDLRPVSVPLHPQFQPNSRYVPQEYHMATEERVPIPENLQPILHNSAMNPLLPIPSSEGMVENQDFNDISPVPDVSERVDNNYSRAAKSGYDSPPSYPQSPPYGYTPPANHYTPHTPAAPSVYAPPPAPASYAPPPAHPPTSKFSILKPDITSLIKPVTTKVATKVSGLIGLVLSLLTGTAPDDLEMKGFKDLVINGIVRPLLIAKGGIKSLISKLTIPVISLLLINLEVLITVWWLWEECPDPVKHVYTKPTDASNYNSYR